MPVAEAKKVKRAVVAGRRVRPIAEPEVRYVYDRDKFHRRLARRHALMGRIERRLRLCWRQDLEARRLASNSHEAQRFIKADRSERTRGRSQ